MTGDEIVKPQATSHKPQAPTPTHPPSRREVREETFSPPHIGRGSERGWGRLAACGPDDSVSGSRPKRRDCRLAAGFTLMELLVALGIFAISAGLIADLFLTASRQQARTIVLSTMQGDARLIVETIARELREGTLDFQSGTTDAPALETGDGELLRFQRVLSGNATRPCPASVSACLYIGRGSSEDALVWAPFTSAEVNVDAFQFWSTPTEDPNVWDEANGRYQSDQQPQVTVHLTLSAAGRPGERSTIEAQTTVASRVYKR